MFKKHVAAIVCGLATAGSLGAGAGTAAAADPNATECAGLPNGVNKLHISTSPQTANQPADVYGGGLLCGSNFVNNVSENGFKSGRILTPTNVAVRCANPRNANACTGEPDLPSGRYIGDVTMDIETVINGRATPLRNLHTKMYVDQAPPTALGGLQHANTDCTATAVACYQGLDDLGTATANVIIKRSAYGKLALEINQPVPFINGIKVYYLKIGGSSATETTPQGQRRDMHLCKHAGPVNGNACGDSAQDWVQKNGPAGSYDCTYASQFFEALGWALGDRSVRRKGLTGYWAYTDPNYGPQVPAAGDTAAVNAFLRSTAPNCAPIAWT